MVDIQMAFDVVIATREHGRGARRQVARKHGVVPSTITEAVARFETTMGVPLFVQTPERDHLVLTAHGEALARHGASFLQSYQIFRKFVQDNGDSDVRDAGGSDVQKI